MAVPCVAPEHYVGLEVRNDACLTVKGLLRDGLEEEVHGLAEALLRPGSRSRNCTPPEAVGCFSMHCRQTRVGQGALTPWSSFQRE